MLEQLRTDRAGDVDVAYLPRHGAGVDHLAVVNALQDAYGDLLMPLDQAGPVARFRALHAVEVLAERR